MSNTTHAKRHAVVLALALGMTALSGHATAQTTGVPETHAMMNSQPSSDTLSAKQ